MWGPVISDPLIYVRSCILRRYHGLGCRFLYSLHRRGGISASGQLSNVAALVSPIFAWIAWIGLVVTVVSGVRGCAGRAVYIVRQLTIGGLSQKVSFRSCSCRRDWR